MGRTPRPLPYLAFALQYGGHRLLPPLPVVVTTRTGERSRCCINQRVVSAGDGDKRLETAHGKGRKRCQDGTTSVPALHHSHAVCRPPTTAINLQRASRKSSPHMSF
ncbi:hypothetical protein CGRA01v4_00210 [Colletotrichum graminicola]|nr:hypothetical protein CGRA01v4_00210 [Colletotrichum graminicola]